MAAGAGDVNACLQRRWHQRQRCSQGGPAAGATGRLLQLLGLMRRRPALAWGGADAGSASRAAPGGQRTACPWRASFTRICCGSAANCDRVPSVVQLAGLRARVFVPCVTWRASIYSILDDMKDRMSSGAPPRCRTNPMRLPAQLARSQRGPWSDLYMDDRGRRPRIQLSLPFADRNTHQPPALPHSAGEAAEQPRLSNIMMRCALAGNSLWLCAIAVWAGGRRANLNTHARNDGGDGAFPTVAYPLGR